MRLHWGAATGLLAGVIISLGGCDDFKSNPTAAQTANAVPANAVLANAAPPNAAPANAAAPSGEVVPVAPAAVTQPPSLLQSRSGEPEHTLAPPLTLVTSEGSATPEAKVIDGADFASRRTAAARRGVLIRAQVILDRAHFSPGVIDGRNGTNFRRALSAFEAANNVAASTTGGLATLDAAGWQALTAADSSPVTQDYVIKPEDVKGPFLGTVPTAMVDLAKLPYLGYTTPVQALAEKFHMDETLLRALNPKIDFSVAGTSIVVVRPSAAPLPPVARVEVDKSIDEVRAYDAAGKIVAMFPATVGSRERPAPSGQYAVRGVVTNPTYTYDPSRLTFGNAAGGKLTIQPGPNNPVGSTWIDLTIETYGIHGAPDPTQIGKTASHGCVRLTNWDAAALGRAVKKGTPVLFIGAQSRKA
jgi:lipoprotein-anchoring transpeptidase ErfK/SrfK